MATMTAPSGRPLGEVFAMAERAGRAAGDTVVPVPMHVVEHANPLDDASPVVRRYAPVLDGVCGFAWITIHPGGSPAARYAKKFLGAKAAYGGGTQIWVRSYNQSMTRKSAYATAFAKVLTDNGITAYAGERMD
jgi:hypothetical protein